MYFIPRVPIIFRRPTHYLLSVLFAILLTLLLFSLLPTDSASAKAHKDMNTSEQALSFSYLNSLSSCIASFGNNIWGTNSQIGIGTTYASNINNGNWFSSAQTINPASKPASFLSPNTDNNGLTHCNSILKSAVGLWGYKNAGELYCSFTNNGSHKVVPSKVFIL